MRAGRAAIMLFAVAALARLLFLFAFVDRGFPFSVFYYGDSRLYREFALAILRGAPFDGGIPFHPPGFAYVLAALISMVGERPTALRAVLAIVASTTVPLTFLLGRALWGTFAAAAGALLATFSFALLVLAVSPNAETIYVPLLLTQAILAVAVGDAWGGGRRRRALVLSLVSGLVLGAASLTRAEHLAFAALVPAALALRRPRPSAREIGVSAVALIGAAAVVIAPWTVQNARAVARFNASSPAPSRPLPTLVLISSYGPLNFSLANRAGADGGFRPDAISGRTGSIDLRDPAQLDRYLDGYRQGFAFLASHPADAARLFAKKLALASGALALGFGRSDVPSGLAGTRRPVDLFVPDRRWWMIVLVALAAWGAVAARRAGGRAAIVWLIVAHKLAVVLAFFGYARLVAQVLPFLFLLAGAGIAAACAGGRRRAFAVAAGWLLGGALTLDLALACRAPGSLVAEGSTDPSTGKIVQDAEVLLRPSGKKP